MPIVRRASVALLLIPLLLAARAVPIASADEAPLDIPDVVERVRPSLVQVVAGNTSGSGVQVAQGILTNHHVVCGADQIAILAPDGTPYAATVVHSDQRFDLALLASEVPLPPLEAEAASAQRMGDTILVLGYPRPDLLGGGPSVTRGLVSAVREDGGGPICRPTHR
jgi:S1-C subfamily serine protease